MGKPNVVMIIADGHRADALGYADHPDLRTPNLDALASHGLFFTQALSSRPDSQLARNAILSGGAPDAPGVAEPILVDRLREAGYLCGAVGRMEHDTGELTKHFDVLELAERPAGAPEDAYHAWLHRQGMEDRVAQWAESGADSGVLAKCLGAVVSNLPASLYPTSWIGDQALRFVQRAREPFFLVLGFPKPAFPYDPPRPWHEIYDPAWLNLPPGWTPQPAADDLRHVTGLDLSRLSEQRLRRIMAHYYANISYIDHQLGRLLATLASRGFTNNILVYTSTRGDYLGCRGLIHACPDLLYDPLIRVPLLIAGVAGQRRGETDAALAVSDDLTPTILDACGLPVPEHTAGASLAPCLRRRNIAPREWAFVRGGPESYCLRGPRYKLLQAPGEEPRFYDLRADPTESEDLHGAERLGPVEERFLRAARNLPIQ